MKRKAKVRWANGPVVVSPLVAAEIRDKMIAAHGSRYREGGVFTFLVREKGAMVRLVGCRLEVDRGAEGWVMDFERALQGEGDHQ